MTAARLIVPTEMEKRKALGLAVIPVADPEAERQKIWKQVADDLAQIAVFGPRVLVAKWIRAKVGSIEVSHHTQKEDKYQGKVGLVLKLGPTAFKNDDVTDFGGAQVKVGDWVWYAYGDGQDTDIVPAGTHDRVPCKMLKDIEIAGIVPRPDMLW